jgi:coenzyme PQQ synthesis protein D (PqqD)
MTAKDTSSTYAINAPDVVAEDFNGQIVILNLANGHYFSLGGIASAIWSLLLAGHTSQSILSSIQAKQPALADKSLAFLKRLIELNLVRAQASGAAGPLEPIGETWSGEAPQIEVFDDLAELIFADPIHDVDERVGWPTPRPAR